MKKIHKKSGLHFPDFDGEIIRSKSFFVFESIIYHCIQRLKREETKREKNNFLFPSLHRHFIMTFEMIFGAKNLLHHVMITHVRALAISSSSPLYRVIMADDQGLNFCVRKNHSLTMQERNAVHAIQKSFLLLRQNLK